MDLNDIPVFRMMTGKMRWLAARQRVLTENVSNADTPQYRPKDLKPVDLSKGGQKASFRAALTRTHPGHIAGSARSEAGPRSEWQRDTYETLPAGNAVVLEEQLVKVATNRQDYSLMTELYRKHVRMFRIALGRNGQ
jgi:flagellar basal-body rod protein FlgB